jgi:hypothetical protein
MMIIARWADSVGIMMNVGCTCSQFGVAHEHLGNLEGLKHQRAPF